MHDALASIRWSLALFAYAGSILFSSCVVGPTDDRPAEEKSAVDPTPTQGGSEQDATARAEYFARILISKVNAQPFWDVAGKRFASVLAEAKNTGDRTLAELQLTIYFLDAAGKPVHEAIPQPVLGGSLSALTDAGRPLRPNYTRKFAGGFEVPSEWAGRVELKGTDLTFLHERPK